MEVVVSRQRCQTLLASHVKEADKGIKDMLKKKGHLVFNGTEIHNYPHCWRSDTPLIYKAVPAWYVNVEDAKERLLAVQPADLLDTRVCQGEALSQLAQRGAGLEHLEKPVLGNTYSPLGIG